MNITIIGGHLTLKIKSTEYRVQVQTKSGTFNLVSLDIKMSSEDRESLQTPRPEVRMHPDRAISFAWKILK